MINHEDTMPITDIHNDARLNHSYDEYLSTMGESRSEAIKRLNKYCLVPYDENIFDFLDDNLIRWVNGEKLIYTEFNFAGGRYGKKTFEIANTIVKAVILALKYNKRVACYCFRYFGADLGELKKEIDNALLRYHLDESRSKQSYINGEYRYSNSYNKPLYRFINGSFIQLWGVYKATDRTITMKGLASAQDFDLAIAFQEEANEFSQADTQAIRFAMRGEKERIYFSATNPDDDEIAYIRYCQENFPFDEHELTTKGYQFKKFIDPDTGRGKVFQYSNYMINPYVTPAELQEMLEAKKHDPYKYRIWGIGMPGSLNTSVFAPYLHDNPKTFIGNQLVIGIDLGYSITSMGHPSRVIITELDLEHQRVHPIAEYSHSNATDIFKDMNVQVKEMVKFIVDTCNDPKYRYMAKNQGITVQVDWGNGGAMEIGRFNEVAQLTYDPDTMSPVSRWLKFEPVDKSVWYDRDRIDITIWLLNTKKMTISKNDTPLLFKEMKLMVYKKNSKAAEMVNTEPKRKDIWDDGWDALMYSLMPYAQSLVSEWQHGLYQKQYQKLVNKGAFTDPMQIDWSI